MTALRCEGVGFVYPDGTRALSGVDLAVEPGESVVGIVLRKVLLERLGGMAPRGSLMHQSDIHGDPVNPG